MSAIAGRLHDAARIAESIETDLPNARDALAHVIAIVDAARGHLQVELDRLDRFGPDAIKSPSEQMRRHGTSITGVAASPADITRLNASVRQQLAGGPS